MTPPREGGARVKGRKAHVAVCHDPDCPCYREGLAGDAGFDTAAFQARMDERRANPTANDPIVGPEG